MNDDDDFVFNGSPASPGLVGSLVVIVLVILFIWWLSSRTKAQDLKVLSYINEHHCVITSYMGGDQKKRAVYQCDNGQKLDFQVREAALK